MIHLITAFSRYQNLPFYLEHIPKDKAIWHVIAQEDSHKDEFNYEYIDYINYGLPGDSRDILYWKLNQFIEKARIIDEDYYVFLNDDDWMQDQIFDQTFTSPVVFTSMYRGHHFIGGHPITTLIPYQGVSIGLIGLEQIVLRGDILKQVRFKEDSGVADGILAMELQTRFPVEHRTDLYMYFNYLEPGRW